MGTYQHVLFDFDGVLCDSLAAALEVYDDLRRTRFPAIPPAHGPDDMVTVYGGPLKTCLSRWLDADDHRAFFDAHSAAMADRAALLRPFAGVAEMLDALPPGSASIVTSAYSTAVRSVLGGARGTLPAAISEIAGRERRQTKTDKILEILAARAFEPSDAVYVGDVESDVLYCRQVPIDVIAVAYGYHPAHHLATCEPTHLAESVDALRELLARVLSHEAVAAARSCSKPSRVAS